MPLLGHYSMSSFEGSGSMNSRRLLNTLVLGVWLFACLSFPVPAQEAKDITIKGQVKLGVHKFTLENGSLYQFEVKAKGFLPGVSLLGNFVPNTADYFKERNIFRGLFMAPKSAEYTLTVTPNIDVGASPPEGLLDYTVTLKTMKLDETPLLKKEDKLTADDPKYQLSFNKAAFKAYPLKLKAGRTYVIDMVRSNPNDNKLDPYLYLENPMKNIIDSDDNSGGQLNARIMFRAKTDGEYRIIATSLSDQSAIGDYTLTVRTVKEGK
jgi:hypothetical protein